MFRQAGTFEDERLRLLWVALVAIEFPKVDKLGPEAAAHMNMPLDKIMHENIDLLIRRLAHENKVDSSMPMGCQAFDMLGHLCAGCALGEHVLFVGFIDQADGAIRKEIHPVAELFRRHRRHAGLAVIEAANVAHIDHPAL